VSGAMKRKKPPSPGTSDPCDGCHECGLRCMAGIQMTKPEFERIVAHLRTLDPRQVARVLDQDKRIVWFEDIETEQCLFYDTTKQRCIIYSARPFICRLFGRVEWLPCPIGKDVPQLSDGIGLIQAYAEERRATFGEWFAEEGIFDFSELTRPS